MSPSAHRSRDLQPILDRMAAGDATAAADLIERSCDRLRRLTRKMLKSCPQIRPWEVTDDVLQGAVMRLQRALSAIKPPTVGAFIGLASLQIRRELVDLIRHYGGPEGEATNRAGDRPDGMSRHRDIRDKAGSSAGPSTLAEWTEFHEKVQQLPDEEREIFDLIYYQGLAQSEVADLLGVVDRTVKRRWRSARLLLHVLLKGAMPGK